MKLSSHHTEIQRDQPQAPGGADEVRERACPDASGDRSSVPVDTVAVFTDADVAALYDAQYPWNREDWQGGPVTDAARLIATIAHRA